jgi:uncharacterized pyridoxamine 5'-phosphate oxidase family protein
MKKQTCNVVRRFTKKTAASRIQRFLRSRRNARQSIVAKPLVLPTKQNNEPSTLEIREFSNKVQARRLSRFMKKVDPNKRRSAFLNGVCSDAGVCIAFGKETATIKKHFDHFVQFRHLVKPAKRIGSVSANGFVKELTYERSGYTAHAVLKSSASNKSDNLYYEYLVGLFINKCMLRFPCFVETYGMFQYKNTDIYQQMKDENSVSVSNMEKGLIPYSNISKDVTGSLALSCNTPLFASVLIQHLKDATTLANKATSSHLFTKNDLMYVLFQVYMPLSDLSNEFTHYDLHTENVLIYEPVKNSYIQYHYHMKNGKEVSFCSSYIAKIIDYGRSFFNDTGNNEIDGSTKKIYDKICQLPECDDCGMKKGYGWLEPITRANAVMSHYISSQKRNHSHDLRLLQMINSIISRNAEHSPSELVEMCRKVKYSKNYGTPEMSKSGLPNKIHTVMDACVALQEMINRPAYQNQNKIHYNSKAKLGDMHVYSDGTPLQFIASV